MARERGRPGTNQRAGMAAVLCGPVAGEGMLSHGRGGRGRSAGEERGPMTGSFRLGLRYRRKCLRWAQKMGISIYANNAAH